MGLFGVCDQRRREGGTTDRVQVYSCEIASTLGSVGYLVDFLSVLVYTMVLRLAGYGPRGYLWLSGAFSSLLVRIMYLSIFGIALISGNSAGHTHRYRYDVVESDRFNRWMDQAVMCCVRCGLEITRNDLYGVGIRYCKDCGSYDNLDEDFYLTHDCAYDTDEDYWRVMLLPSDVKLDSVNVDGCAEYSGSGGIVVFEGAFDMDVYRERKRVGEGTLLSLVER